jgi:hypothetical protein
MLGAGRIATIFAALACGPVVCATPAAAEVIEFKLGTEPAVELLSYALSAHAPSFTVTAPLDRSTELWSDLLATGRVVPTAVVTETADRTVFTWDFTDVLAASVIEHSGSGAPTVTATFDYGTVSEHISIVPEPSSWAMMLLGFGGLGISWYAASRRRGPQFA